MTMPAKPAEACFVDHFDDDHPAGTVVGSLIPGGVVRRGADVEGLITIDHGALRLRPLARPGWGRQGIAYGPYRRAAGLAMAARVLNGHNSSQTYYFPETRGQRLRRVLSATRSLRFRRPVHFENLAVGWFGHEAPRNPLRAGNSFVMHAANRDNGELWAGVDHREQRAVLGVQNLEIVYVVALRERGAMYFTASTPGARGLGAFPELRPVALDLRDRTAALYAGVQQRILGEVGYRVDTRVAAVAVDVVSEWSSWYGSAHVADRLDGRGMLQDESPDVGGSWRLLSGDLWRTAAGVTGQGAAAISADEPTGLLHVVAAGERGASCAIVFRGGMGGRWVARLDDAGIRLCRTVGAVEEELATSGAIRLVPGRLHTFQVTDDGTTIGVHVDGRLAFDAWTVDERDADELEIGLALTTGARLEDFEAHPRAVVMPRRLDVGEPWAVSGHRLVIDERFDVEAADLDGVVTPTGGHRWQRTLGEGTIELPPGPGARVRADRDNPNPGRTVYTVSWKDVTCADLELDMIPPGTARHQAENCRGGVVFWQDEDNYLLANIFLDDVYDGASVSTFYHLGGHEDMYDAVWALVWPVRWGEPCRLRVAFDGERFLAWHDGFVVLQRALTDVYPASTRLSINRVGIVVNREWGDDTGTIFTGFRGSASSVAPT